MVKISAATAAMLILVSRGKRAFTSVGRSVKVAVPPFYYPGCRFCPVASEYNIIILHYLADSLIIIL